MRHNRTLRFLNRIMLQTLRSLNARDRQPELMDDPRLDPAEHHRALQGLRRVNWISGAVSSMWNSIAAAFPADRRTPIRILDVASGGGDVATGLWKKAQRSRRPVRVVGCDISEFAVRLATARAASARAAVRFEVRDVLNSSLPDDYDVICCSLFLHHLDDDDIILLLKAMRDSGASMIVISDLIRSRVGYVLCRVGTQLLSRSPIVHVDGPLSVRAALTIPEMHQLASAAGLDAARITRHWPERFLLNWCRSRIS